MLLARISFIPQFDHEEGELTWIAQTLLAELQRNGQICGEPVMGWNDGILEAYVYAAHRQSLNPNACSESVLQAERWVVQQFGIEPECEILDDNQTLRVSSIKSAKSLFLYCSSTENGSPLRHGERGVPLALPLLSLPESLIQDLTCWQLLYQQTDGLWLHSDCLEQSAFQQLSAYDSELMITGRQLAADVEKSLNIPVFTYLLNFENVLGGLDSVCPACGQNWTKRRKSFPSLEPFYRFHFQCEGCRLVSHAS